MRDGAEPAASSAGDETIRKEILRQYKAFRDRKDRYFPSGLCRDRNLEMLLGLYEAALESSSMTAKGLAALTGLDHGAALRRLNALEQKGLIQRTLDRADRRRTSIFLSENGRASVERFVDSCAAEARAGSSVPFIGA